MRSIGNLLTECYIAGQNSPDPSTQNGGILVDDDWETQVTSWNAFPSKVEETPERWERPQKYFYVEHCERNLIYWAARNGIKTSGLTMVVPWAACADCARAIIQGGIKRLIRHYNSPVHGNWNDSIVAGDEMMKECGIEIIEVMPLSGYTLLRNGIPTDTGEL